MVQLQLRSKCKSNAKFQNAHHIRKCLCPIHMSKMQEEVVRYLCSRYAAMTLESELNELRVQVQEEAKKDFQQRKIVQQHSQ